MAATSHPLATQAALDVMRQGGSALDAAIAANACLGLMEPTGCGIGGDLFAIVWDPTTRSLHGYNGSGRSPSGVTLDDLREILSARKLEEIPRTGPLTATVPGCVEAWFALHERFGKLPMREVLAPAIAYAREGFPISPRIGEAWAISADRFGPRGMNAPGFAEVFMVEDGAGARRAPAVGERFVNPGLAHVYEAIATQGPKAFYEGRVAEAIERTLAAQLGTTWLTREDLAKHRGEWVTPVSASYRGVEVWELPPNGQGIAALQILQILEGFDLRAMGWGSAEYVHTFIEAKKLAFEDRARMYADPQFVPPPVERLISDAHAELLRARIDPNKAARTIDAGDGRGDPAGPDTVYLTVADERGMMVSLIQSNYRGMGSGVMPLDAEGVALGFMMQSRGEQFALVEGHANVFAPGKRPFHTIIPAFVTKDGEPWMSFGLMGGAMQPQGHAQIIVNMVDFGMTLQQAGDAPRIHHDGSTEPAGLVRPMRDGGVVNLEPGFPRETIEGLIGRGHVIRPAPTAVFGGYQAILRERGMYVGATESRKDGHAAGY